MSAGLATLGVLKETDPYPVLSTALERLLDCLQTEATSRSIQVRVNHIGSMAGIFFNPGPVDTFATVMASDAKRYAHFFHAMLASGLYRLRPTRPCS